MQRVFIHTFQAIFDEFIFNHLPRNLIYIRASGNSFTIEIISGSSISSLFKKDLHHIDEKYTLSVKKKAIHDDLKRLLKYAILSHRWYEEGEPSFQEMSSNPHGSGKGFEKLMEFCRKAEQFGCKLAWSDTCCINKSSSAELDEAIRSMFRWYRQAHICIVHLAGTLNISELKDDEWFMRGWTLQELLAPKMIKFYGKNWEKLSDIPNDKEDLSLMNLVSRITNIPLADLTSFKPGTRNIRQRMYWASKRQTTRVEDISYCLVGIFDVNLSIAYGEGDWAFYRLMEVIIQRCDEWGIFAWAGTPSSYGRTKAIARSPECYQEIHTDGFPVESTTKVHGDTSFTLSRRGLHLVLMIAIGDLQSTGKADHYEFAVSHTLGSDRPDFMPIEIRISVEDLGIEEDEWAIGILNYRATEEPEEVGKLEGGKDYVCFLLRRLKAKDESTKTKESEDRVWKKQPTDNILVVHTCFQTRLESREPLKRLWL
ncbi:hypothetical protein J3R82DRAFT_2573 [Butyriboletus roseoflavus]|nr:hypothetical protein J3R82DRAFT_2573 [Butyriboletus roseoflavus]